MARRSGSRGLSDELEYLHRRITEFTQRKSHRPLCIVRLATNQTVSSGTTWYARNGWYAPSDERGLYRPYAMTGRNAAIEAPFEGRYCVLYHAAMSGPSTSAVAEAHVRVNGTHVAVDGATYLPAASGLGCILDAQRAYFSMAAGDTVEWSHYTTSTATLRSVALNVPTELALWYVGRE